MKITIEQLAEIIKTAGYNNDDIPASWLANRILNNADNAEDITESIIDDEIQNLISQSEIIYYSRAMAYLSDNDDSLNQSIRLASEYGYEPQNINSELLATLLLQENLRDEYSGAADKIMEALEEWIEENESEEE